MSSHSTERGAILPIVLGTALLCAIAAYAVLIIVAAQGRHAQFYRGRLRARYAAEAGMVWAKERLWLNPTYCGNPAPPPIEGMVVSITISDCTAGSNKTIAARATY